MNCEREMTLKEWVERLPEFHYAHKEYKRLVAAVEAAQQPQAALLTNPYTGTPRDYRDVEDDPAGVLIQEPGAPLRAAKPQPQASAEDVALVDEFFKATWVSQKDVVAMYAWQRIRASLGVGRE
jgi:hypothetical protein